MIDNFPQKWRVLLSFAIFMVAAYLLYLRAFSGVWLMDDLPVIVNNPDIRSFGNFLEDYYPGRPLRELTYLVDYCFFGLEPAGYYVQNIFWHGLCACLVFLLAKQLQAPSAVAWFSALLFLFHPVQVEVVANVSHRKDSLALAFCLLSFCSYLHGRLVANQRGRWWLLAAFLLWGVALTAKQNALVLPCVVFAYELQKLRPDYRRKGYYCAVFIVGLSVLGRLTYLVSSQVFKGEIRPALLKLGYFTEGTVEEYFRTVFKAWTFMLSKLVYPVDLSMEYTFSVPIHWTDLWVVSGIVGAGVLAVGFFLVIRRTALVYVGLVWLLAFWLPTSNLLGHLSYFSADRYWYAPLVGLSLLAAYGLWRLLRENRNVFVLLAFLSLSLLGWKTWQQQGYWSDADQFYEHMHSVSPKALEGLIGLGNIAMERGDYPVATEYFLQALMRSPSDGRITQSLGYIAYLQGQYDAAVDYFEKALAIDPGMVEAYNNLGSVYDDLGQTDNAINALENALAINPHFEKAYTNLGVVYERGGDLEKAEALHRRALLERHDYGQAHYNLGNTLYHAGRKSEAMQSYLMATRYTPENADAWYNYATVAHELGQHDVFLAALTKLRTISPQLADELKKDFP